MVMQKIEVKDQTVQKLERKQTDGRTRPNVLHEPHGYRG